MVAWIKRLWGWNECLWRDDDGYYDGMKVQKRVEKEDFGEWMIVDRQQRRQPRQGQPHRSQKMATIRMDPVLIFFLEWERRSNYGSNLRGLSNLDSS